jgi:hypothetical protein
MKVGRFKDGPPVSFKLLARDRAGNATISPVLTVGTKSEAAAQCTLSITTEATTDTPAKTVTATNVAVSTIKTGANAVTIEAKESVVGDPCDATTTVCSEDSKISFAAEVTFAENGDASGTVTVTPGDLTDVSTTGSGKNSTTGFESIELSGEVTVEGETGILNLSCKNG